MLGSLGFFASKGMVAVPNLSGLTTVNAEAAILAAGLSFGGSTSSSTGDSALHNKIATQSVASGTLLDYDSQVSFVYYNYVASPPPPGPPPSYMYTYYCRTRTTSGVGQVFSSSTDVSGNTCGVSITACVYARTDIGGDPGDPGSIPACPGCTAGCDPYINVWSPCVNGSQYKARDCVRSDCTTYTDTTSNTQTCGGCTPTAGATRFKDSCATSLEYYDTCTGSSQGCVPPSPPSGGGGTPAPPSTPTCTPSSSGYLQGCCTVCTTTIASDCSTNTTCSRI